MEDIDSKQVLELIGKLDDANSELLLSAFKVSDIANALSDRKYIGELINCYHNHADALDNLLGLYEEGTVKSETEKIYDRYCSLDEENQKELSVLLYNDQKFQGYLTHILIGIIKDNLPEMVIFLKAFGIDLEKNMLDAIRTGKGYKRYIVE